MQSGSESGEVEVETADVPDEGMRAGMVKPKLHTFITLQGFSSKAGTCRSSAKTNILRVCMLYDG
eukprot:3001378-Amphidinium_carterae.1